jgi:ubiquinone biosynthesis protein
MKLATVPQIYRNVKRWTEILSVLSKYGLADWISRLNIDFAKDRLKAPSGEALARHSWETRVRLALSELGPTFIKLGQLLSTRPDVVGVDLAEELTKLQTRCPSDPPAKVRTLIEEELGQHIDQLFVNFSDEPLASASIGQVHAATLRSGVPVVVKVQHLGIQNRVREDLDVLAGIAQLAELIPEYQAYRPTATVAELARTLRRELDFGREEGNLTQFATLFADDETIRIPKPVSEFCTGKVLTMERLDGLTMDQEEKLFAAGFDLEEVARRGAEIYLKMIFEFGHYHADPHPGNIVLMPGNVIGLLDFGMVGRISEKLRSDIERMLMAIAEGDVAQLTHLIKRVGNAPKDLDESALSSEVAEFVGMHGNRSMKDFDVSGALNDMVEIVRRFKILLPAPAAMLIKTLVTLEGTSQQLSPSFSLMEVMRPFHRRLIRKRMSPKRNLRRFRSFYLDVEQLVEMLPQRSMEILDQIQAGKFDVHLDHRGLQPSVNRLVLGMLASALFLGSSWLLAAKVPPVLFQQKTWFGMQDLSILGLVGCVSALLVGARLLRAIHNSGRLDKKE